MRFHPGTIGAVQNLLISDTGNYAQPSVSKPAYLTPITDETFGSIITRITGDPGDEIIASSGKYWGTNVHHQYSKLPVWNRDETMMYIETNNGGSGSGGITFLDGETYEPLFWRAYKGNEARWDPADAAQMYYTTGTALRSWNVTADTTALVRTFTGYSDLLFGNYEGNFSRDGDFVVLSGTRDSDSASVVFAYQISTDTKYDDLSVTALSKTLDYAGISPLGTYMLLYFTDETQVVYDKDGTLVTSFSGTQLPAHAGMTIDEHGDEVSVGARSAGDGSILKRRLSDGQITVLTGNSWSYHTSACNFRGGLWAASDYWSDSGNPYVNEIVISMLDGSATYRICHHHNVRTDYESEPHVSISPSGKRVVFASTWGELSGRPVQVYVADFRSFTIPSTT